MSNVGLIPMERIVRRIYVIRGQNVMLDSDIAELYEVPTKRLNEALKRNLARFPADFAFQLSENEAESLRSQIATLKTGRGQHFKYLPWAFTEHGVAMLASILKSERAIQVNIAIVRTFIALRDMLAADRDLARKVKEHDEQIAFLFQRLDELLAIKETPKHPVGYIKPKD